MTKDTYRMTSIEKRIFIIMSVFLGLFLIFLVFYHIKDIQFHNPEGSNCGLKLFFHLYCPGCGGTRALDAFLHGRFLHSLLLQPVIMYLFGYFLSYYIPSLCLILGIRKKPIHYMVYLYILCGLLVLIILFFIARNLLLVYGGYDYIGECLKYWN